MTTDADTGPDPMLDVSVEQVEAVMSPEPGFLEWVHQLEVNREETRVALLAEVKDAKAVRAGGRGQDAPVGRGVVHRQRGPA